MTAAETLPVFVVRNTQGEEVARCAKEASIDLAFAVHSEAVVATNEFGVCVKWRKGLSTQQQAEIVRKIRGIAPVTIEYTPKKSGVWHSRKAKQAKSTDKIEPPVAEKSAAPVPVVPEVKLPEPTKEVEAAPPVILVSADGQIVGNHPFTPKKKQKPRKTKKKARLASNPFTQLAQKVQKAVAVFEQDTRGLLEAEMAKLINGLLGGRK